MSIEKYSLAQDIFHFTSLLFLINLGHKLIQFPKKNLPFKENCKVLRQYLQKRRKTQLFTKDS